MLGEEHQDMTRILLVEDSDNIRDMLRRRLEKRNYHVLVACDGSEACSVASAERPDLILMDMHLPVLDGWEATRQLKQSSATRDIPIIALTADAMAGDREKALQAGCDEYETKPVDLKVLLDKVQMLLEARRSHERAN
jgi:CheY-like chemotaxis protein